MAASFAPIDEPGAGVNKVSSNKKKVAYFYDSDVGNFAYNAGHPMKPHRIRMAHSLVMNYGLYKHMEIYRAKPATAQEMTQFHTDDYVNFLQSITPDIMASQEEKAGRFNVGDDCPVFDGLFEFCGISAGGSMEGAARLNRGKCDIAVNWAGGLHHAKKAEASGFCYINDIVLGILELLRFHQKVLYIDIDVHHGDGVEEAFYSTNRVMTVSLHKYGEYFPGTGELRDVGIAEGRNHSVNFPLRDGIDDAGYKFIFERVIQSVMDNYQPDAIVLQCGGDSLSGDRLGCFNLSMRGHAQCVRFVKSFNKPTMILGGGGYTMRNVARTWAYETGLLLDQEQNMSPDLPFTDYYEYYAPDFELDVKPSNMDNANSQPYLQNIVNNILANLRETASGSTSVQQTELPSGGDVMTGETLDERESRENDEDADKESHKDLRSTQRQRDQHIDTGDDDFDSDNDEAYDDSLGVKRPPPPDAEKSKYSIMAPLNRKADSPDPADARSLADNPTVEDMPDLPPKAVTNVNAAVGQDVMQAKALGQGLAPSSAPTENGTTLAQADAADVPDANAMDIDPVPAAHAADGAMDPASATDAPNDTKPTSTTNGDVEMTDAQAQAREEGMLKRDKADVDAEVAAIIAGGGNSSPPTGSGPVA